MHYGGDAATVPQVHLQGHVHLQQLIRSQPLGVSFLHASSEKISGRGSMSPRHLLLKDKGEEWHHTHRFHIYDPLPQKQVVPLELPKGGAARPCVSQLLLQKSFGLLQGFTQLLLLLQGSSKVSSIANGYWWKLSNNCKKT